MSSITSDPIFQILTTTILTLLGTAYLTYYFYKKQKKDMDKPIVSYRLENFNQKPTFIIQTQYILSIHHLTLTSTKPKGKPGCRTWRESVNSLQHCYNQEIGIPIPKHLYNMSSFKIKIQYQYREHKYTDNLTIYSAEENCILH